MRYQDTVFSGLLKGVNRRRFQASVSAHKGDRYAKTLSSWDHFVAMLFGQLSGAKSLRALESGFNAGSHQHYHLNTKPIARSTLGDANERRPVGIFTDVLADVIARLGRKARKEAQASMAMIDSTPIPLGDRFACRASNGRIKGMKLHVVFDPDTPSPLHTDITPANVNDVSFRDQVKLEPGITYVFDKGYYDFGWWRDIDKAGAFFVTRSKVHSNWQTITTRDVPTSSRQTTKDDGFTILTDDDVMATSKSHKPQKLTCPVRLVTLKRDTGQQGGGQVLTLITNDKTRTAREIALCYKQRWSIELFFKWIKQNLNLSSFLGRSENAVKIQITIAMIAFVLIQLARQTCKTHLTSQRFIQLLPAMLGTRRNIATLEKPPPNNPHKRQTDPNQLTLSWTN